MTVWKLTPVDLLDSNWNASSHRGEVIVRARSEEAARALAADAFNVATRFSPGAGIQAPPWTRPLVCEPNGSRTSATHPMDQ